MKTYDTDILFKLLDAGFGVEIKDNGELVIAAEEAARAYDEVKWILLDRVTIRDAIAAGKKDKVISVLESFGNGDYI